MRQLELIMESAGNHIPESLNEKTDLIKKILEFSRRVRPLTGMLIAAARRDNFNDDIDGWVIWCRDNFAMEGADRDHHRKIGDLLLDVKVADAKIYQRLFMLDTDKLLSIARLERKEVARFLAAYEVEALTREEVREAINICLGIKTDGKAAKSKYQPGLWESIDALISCEEKDFSALAKAENFDEIKARKTAYSAAGLLYASMEYWETRGNPETAYLVNLEDELRTAADRLKNIRNAKAQALMSKGA